MYVPMKESNTSETIHQCRRLDLALCLTRDTSLVVSYCLVPILKNICVALKIGNEFSHLENYLRNILKIYDDYSTTIKRRNINSEKN